LKPTLLQSAAELVCVFAAYGKCRQPGWQSTYRWCRLVVEESLTLLFNLDYGVVCGGASQVAGWSMGDLKVLNAFGGSVSSALLRYRMTYRYYPPAAAAMCQQSLRLQPIAPIAENANGVIRMRTSFDCHHVPADLPAPWNHSGVMLRCRNAWRYLRHQVRGHGQRPFAFHSEPWNASSYPKTALTCLKDPTYLTP
jgi:hypothetical protein